MRLAHHTEQDGEILTWNMKSNWSMVRIDLSGGYFFNIFYILKQIALY